MDTDKYFKPVVITTFLILGGLTVYLFKEIKILKAEHQKLKQ